MEIKKNMGPEVIAAIIGGVVALGSTIAGVVSSKSQSDANIAAQKEFNQSQSLNSKIQEAKANGISPLAVLGQNASNAVVSAPQANADYSGFSNFGNSLMSTVGSLVRQSVANKGAKDVQKMKNETSERISSLQISSSEKMKLQEMSNALTIANNKNSTDKEIQEGIRTAQHNLEILRSSNAEFVQKEQLKNAMNMLDKQLENAQKERESKMRLQLVHEAFTTFNTMIYSASSMFGGNVSSYIDNLGRGRLGF